MTEHQLTIGKGRTARWVSFVLALAPSEAAAPTRVERLRPVRPSPAADGTVQTDLIGGKGGLPSSSGLQWKEIEFVDEGTTFVHVGNERRAVAYVLQGQGSIENEPTETGAGVLLEGVGGLSIGGSPGFRVLLSSVPCPETAHP